MSKKVTGEDGQTYKMVSPSTNRKRTVEIVAGIISLLVSIVSLASGFGLAAIADGFGGGGSYTMELLFGILLSVVAFVLTFFIKQKHALISWSIIILGVVLLFSAGDFGIAGGILFTITGLIALFRK
ncbi:hypothetical protein PESHB5_10550 [Pediococcus parvulus]|uniref:hypothetical protein n=1 Tax=Pediococcus parvulus TaxID=54062 RepID=UPI0021A2D7F9|nr:hypothetical protein [Pediococcus parvulus]MCT3030233.1 hypothetical protein [Pediococcus parvulus]